MLDLPSVLRLLAAHFILDSLWGLPTLLGFGHLGDSPDDTFEVLRTRSSDQGLKSDTATSVSFYALMIASLLFAMEYRLAVMQRLSRTICSRLRDSIVRVVILEGIVGTTLRIEAVATRLPPQDISFHTGAGTLMMLLDVLGVGEAFAEESGRALAPVTVRFAQKRGIWFSQDTKVRPAF